MFITRRKFKKASSGFTLIELLVTITIFVILTTVVLISQAKFNSTILLTNLAYDTALTVRQAQTFGINIKEFNKLDGTSDFLPYGVHFNKGAPGSFILFADLDYNMTTRVSDGLFDFDNPADLATCDATKGCVNRYNIKRGNHIFKLCTNGPNAEDTCNEVDSFDIVFKRPNPDARIKANSGGDDLELARIVLSNPDNDNFREIVVQANGLIYIKSR